jgi:transcriptional regulator with XRE-family HTH domain
MKWLRIRAYYAELFYEAIRNGATQESIAERGGLVKEGGDPKQPLISKLLENHKLGPTVETFTGAVEGLGLSMVEFFTLLEQRTNSEGPSSLSVIQLHPVTASDDEAYRVAIQFLRQAVRYDVQQILHGQPLPPSDQKPNRRRPRRRRG